MDNLPNEIVLQILGYLNLGGLIQCARVSKRLNAICEDKSLSYRSNMLVMQGLTVKGRKSISDTLIANPELTEVNISPMESLEWGVDAEIFGAHYITKLVTQKSLGLFYGNAGLVYQINVVHPNKRVFLKITQTAAKKIWRQIVGTEFIGLAPHLFGTLEDGTIFDISW